MDKIFIEGLTLQSIIGVYDWERTEKQRVIVDAELTYSLSQAGQTDSVADTIDYAAVVELLKTVAEDNSPQLLERLANIMCQAVFEKFPVQSIKLKLSKPDILPEAQNVAIQIERDRKNWLQ